MNELLHDIPDWLWLTGIGIVSSIALWWRRQAAGVSFFQEIKEDERDKVEDLMRERIEYLELKIEQKEEENEVLRSALNCDG